MFKMQVRSQNMINIKSYCDLGRANVPGLGNTGTISAQPSEPVTGLTTSTAAAGKEHAHQLIAVNSSQNTLYQSRQNQNLLTGGSQNDSSKRNKINVGVQRANMQTLNVQQSYN